MDTASTLKSLPEEEVEALFACTCLLHGNWPKSKPADVAFIPGLAVDNWQEDNTDDGILHTAARLWPVHTRYIALPGYAGTYPHGRSGPRSETGYPGYARWLEALWALGIPEKFVVPYASDDVGPDGESWHTRSEVDAFLEVALRQEWGHIVVVTTPFHTLRVMLALVKALRDHRLTLRVDPVTPLSMSWAKCVYHSQGLRQLPRYEHIAQEWDRIPSYQRNGWLCSFAELRDYLVTQHERAATKK